MSKPVYTKIVVLAGPWVEALICKNGSRIQKASFMPFVANAFFIEGRFKAAHKWADKLIKVLEAQETE